MKIAAIIKIFLFAVLALMCSCEYPCGRASDFIALVGFTRTESDTIIVRRFTKSTDFSIQKDSLLIDSTNANLQRNGDTLIVLRGWGDNYATITSDFDYEIFLPGANVTYTLSDIKEPLQYGSRGGGKVYCVNTISAYKLNGELVTAGKDLGRIYLKK